MGSARSGETKRFDLFVLDTPALTIAFWGAVLLATAAFYTTRYLPLIDYQQHVAVAALLHRLFDARAPEHATYAMNLVTYNGGFHVIVAVLAYLMPVEQAARVVMSTYPLLLSCAALAVARTTDRPRWYALLIIPITYSRAMAWGFANWNLTFPIAVLGICWFVRYARGERSMFFRILFAACFCAYGHVLAMLCLCFGVLVVLLSRVIALSSTWAGRVSRMAAMSLPLMPGVAWCVLVYRYQTTSSFTNWSDAYTNGEDDPLWYKLWHLLDMSVGNFRDRSDDALFLAALAIVFALLFSAAPEARPTQEQASLDLRAMRWLAVAFFGCYLVIPKAFVATWFIYERFPTLAVLFLVGALPVRLFPRGMELRTAAAVVAVASSANLVRQFATTEETADALAIVDDMPRGKKLLQVTYEPSTSRNKREIYLHLAALYQARTSAPIGCAFTKYESMPVHTKPGTTPPQVPRGFEWNGALYDPRSDLARAYDLTLVRAPDLDSPTDLVFRDEAKSVKLLSHRGRFWLYDTSALAPPP